MKKLFLNVLILGFFSIPVFAHEGGNHGESDGGGALTELVLSESMITNLGIKSESARLQDVSRTLDMMANIDYLPEKQAIISAKAEGTIARLLVNAGQEVKKGDTVIIMQPRLVGNPPVSLTSPIDGFVTGLNVITGQSITPDQALLRIADLSKVLVRGQIYEDKAQKDIRIGQTVIVTTASIPDRIFEGTVHTIDATLQSGSRIREINSLVENPDGKLLANMQANMSVSVGEKTERIVIPQRAVLGELGDYFVYVQEDHHFYRRDVTLGQKFGPLREIIDGIEPDERVVTVGNYQLQFVTTPKEGDEDDDHGHSH